MHPRKYDCVQTLQAAGIPYEDACALRRISMTLHRWHELECGTDNSRTHDRERGALKRLAAIMARYPGFAAYVQGGPRGCALYVLTPEQLARIADSGSTLELECSYSRGIAVCK